MSIKGRTPSRRKARRDALFLLYQHDLTGADLAALKKTLEVDRQARLAGYTARLSEGVLTHLDRIDSLLEAHIKSGWNLGRLAPIERNLLRLALYEMLYEPDIPLEVSIDEAVRLTKRYASPEAAGLVNGILGSIGREGLAKE